MIRTLADKVRALLVVLGPLDAGSRLLLLRLVARFGWRTVLAGAAITVFALFRYRTAIAWVLAGWCVAAWMHAPNDETEDDGEGAGEEPPTEPQQALAKWLLETIGKRPGIHLRDLYPAMRELPGQEERTDAELRGALKALGVPVHRSLRIGRVAGRSGVRGDDVAALLRSLGEQAVDFDGDAGQADDSPHVYAVGEGVETA